MKEHPFVTAEGAKAQEENKKRLRSKQKPTKYTVEVGRTVTSGDGKKQKPNQPSSNKQEKEIIRWQ